MHRQLTRLTAMTMVPKIDTDTLEDELVQLALTEAVGIVLETPLRDPILEAVEAKTGRPVEETTSDGIDVDPAWDETDTEADDNSVDPTDDGGNRRTTMALQGLAVFVVMFVVLYVVLRHLTGDETA